MLIELEGQEAIFTLIQRKSKMIMTLMDLLKLLQLVDMEKIGVWEGLVV